MYEAPILYLLFWGVWLITFLTLVVISLYMLWRKMSVYSDKLNAVRDARQEDKLSVDELRGQVANLSVRVDDLDGAFVELLDILTDTKTKVSVSVKRNKRNAG